MEVPAKKRPRSRMRDKGVFCDRKREVQIIEGVPADVRKRIEIWKDIVEIEVGKRPDDLWDGTIEYMGERRDPTFL